jgi:hypothetical protein
LLVLGGTPRFSALQRSSHRARKGIEYDQQELSFGRTFAGMGGFRETPPAHAREIGQIKEDKNHRGEESSGPS